MQLLGEDYEVPILPQFQRPVEPRDLASAVGRIECQHVAVSVERLCRGRDAPTSTRTSFALAREHYRIGGQGAIL